MSCLVRVHLHLNKGRNIVFKNLTFLFIAALSITALLYWKAGAVFLTQDDGNQSCGATPEMVLVEGGSFTMGAGAVYPEETPALPTHIADFYMSRFEVTNAEYSEFVEATGYVTVAERQRDPNDFPGVPPEFLKPGSVVFALLSETPNGHDMPKLWKYIHGANWRHPMGPGSSIKGKEWFPVVHIALEDALAYAEWKGHRLPNEAEHEYASRGGLEGAKYATGATLKQNGAHVANTWQGFFPFTNSKDDGFEGLAPVGCYAGNSFGLHDLIGNVWEWTHSPYYPRNYTPETLPANMPADGFDPKQRGVPVGVIKGGSFLCSENFCMRYRPAARHSQDIALGTSHIGFRTVADVH